MDYKDWWFRTLDTLGFWGGVNSLYNNNVQVEAIKELTSQAIQIHSRVMESIHSP